MRFFSILALLSASYVAASDNHLRSPKETVDAIDLAAEQADIAAQEKRQQEQNASGDADLRVAINAKEREVEELKAQLNLQLNLSDPGAADVEEEDEARPSLQACTDDADWKDKTGIGCNFYSKNSYWCDDALNFADKNGKSAKDACCVCGGGDSGYGKGVYWIKSRKTGEYLGIYKITSPHVRMSDNLWSPYIEIELVPLPNNEYALMSKRYGDRFLSVGESGEVKLYHLIGDWERFKIMEVNGGVQFFNVKWQRYLDVYNGVKTIKSPMGTYTTFNLVPSN